MRFKPYRRTDYVSGSCRSLPLTKLLPSTSGEGIAPMA
jgi:hypothetical protein